MLVGLTGLEAVTCPRGKILRLFYARNSALQSITNSVVNRFPLQLVGFEPRVQVGPFKSERPIIDPRVGDALIPAKIPELTLGEAEVGTGFIEVHVR
jgi:hypothetical protein